jgi:branched-subunit amino acid transport protein
MGMIVTLIDKDVFNESFRKILNYVPSVVFPSIIFPGILLDDYGTLVAISDPKIYGAITAIIVGYLSRNVILTIISGLTSY